MTTITCLGYKNSPDPKPFDMSVIHEVTALADQGLCDDCDYRLELELALDRLKYATESLAALLARRPVTS